MTYADTYGRDEVGPDDWVLHREWVLAREIHPLSVRRAEATKIAIEDLVAPSNHLRWALGVAAGALLTAGTFVASSLSGTSEGANTAGSVPEHVFAPLAQRLSVTEPPTNAPAPERALVNEQPQQETAPTSTEPQADAVTAQDPTAGRGENQRTASSANTPAPAPAPAPAQNQQRGSDGQWGSGTQRGYGSQWDSSSQWGYGQEGYGTQQQSPVTGFGDPTRSSYSAATSTPNGPAMSMLDPFCNTMGS